jgi:hypothetical protein
MREIYIHRRDNASFRVKMCVRLGFFPTYPVHYRLRHEARVAETDPIIQQPGLRQNNELKRKMNRRWTQPSAANRNEVQMANGKWTSTLFLITSQMNIDFKRLMSRRPPPNQTSHQTTDPLHRRAKP